MREPHLITIPRFSDQRGNLSVIEWAECFPFIPKRFYYIYDANPATRRGGHSHWKEEQAILALSGSFSVLVDNGRQRTEYLLDRPDIALYLPALLWHEVFEFSAGAICAVFASTSYNKEDYCLDYQQFIWECRKSGSDSLS
jgi:hypothetical protein